MTIGEGRLVLTDIWRRGDFSEGNLNLSTTTKLAMGSIIVGIIVLAIKFLAYWITGSIALYSDALESTVNIVTAFSALLAIRFAAKPADENHPYGHQKAEYFSAILVSVMIAIAALLILQEAYHGLTTPRVFDVPIYGLLVNLGATVINSIWCYVLITYGRRHRSPALVADGWHIFTDVITSVGVTAGLFAAIVTGWAILDPLLAAMVALNILYSGWLILRGSMVGLMDEAVADDVLLTIRSIITTEATGAIEAHDLRTRQAGNMIFIDFHLVVSGELTVSQSHAICDKIEDGLRAKIEHVLVTIHVEPEDKTKTEGTLKLGS